MIPRVYRNDVSQGLNIKTAPNQYPKNELEELGVIFAVI